MRIEGKTIVVTGGASGIGRALAHRFKTEGARAVVVADRDEAGVRAVAEEISGTGHVIDVSSGEQIEALVEETERDQGPIDLFCSNAGILAIGGAEVPDAEWTRIWQVNVHAHVLAARALVPRMTERGGGYLLNTASAAGLLTQIGSAPYSVTKHAAVGLAEWLSITHGGQGIKVSVLCPQAVRTAMTAGSDEGGVAGVDGLMEPEEIAECVVAGLATEQFLILPHPEVLEYMRRKTNDYDRWLRGMRRLQERFI
ncbi:MAG: SDR family NAD(P)-dependent oxidoreductase [Candidatus Binatia bacterium]|nr:SDR family NAD(P)-dependent oxidoreductase [Candidatus Binatia bacterium]